MGGAHSSERSDPMVREYDMATKCDALEVYLRPEEADRCYLPIVGFPAPSRPWSWWVERVRQARGDTLVDVASREVPTGYRIATPPEARAVRLSKGEVKRRYCEASGGGAGASAMSVEGPCLSGCYDPACLPHCAPPLT